MFLIFDSIVSWSVILSLTKKSMWEYDSWLERNMNSAALSNVGISMHQRVPLCGRRGSEQGDNVEL